MKNWFLIVLHCVILLSAQAQNDISYSPPKEVQTQILQEPAEDKLGNISQKTIHRLNDRVILISPFGTKPNAMQGAPTAGLTTAGTPITYHNGPVMTKVSAIYIVWYGNWNQTNGSDNAVGQQIIRDALFGLSTNAGTTGGGASYSGITTGANAALGAYTQAAQPGVTSTQVSAISSPTIYEYTDAYSQGLPRAGTASLSDTGVRTVIKNAMSKAPGWSTVDSNAIYLVLSSSDVNETSGFCTRYCGWHTFTTALNTAKTPVKYAFVGNANRCLASCAPQSTSPNNNAGVDGMISVIAHELEEIVTDPQLNAWYDSTGNENGDKCAWTFGSSTGNMNSATGPYYNVTLANASGGSRNYLLQRALAPSNAKCYVDASGNQ